ncbi:hypothetical protein EFU33_16395 [Vibrio cholerae]|nr:hypothetical protein [Vibrio cholerae]
MALPSFDNYFNCSDLFEDVAARYPLNVAVRIADKIWTYKELQQISDAIAASLSHYSPADIPIVGIFINRSIYSIASMIACWKAELPYLMLDTEVSVQLNEKWIERLGIKLLLCEQNTCKGLNLEGITTLCVNQLYDEQLVTYPVRTTRSSIASLVSTSGTTGNPKLVQISHANILNYTQAFLARVGYRNKSFGSFTSLASDLGNTAVFSALFTGATLVLVEKNMVLEHDELASFLSKYPIDLIKCTPSIIAMIHQSGVLKDCLPKKQLVLGGEVLDETLLKFILAQSSTLQVFNHYGPTESTVGVICGEVSHLNIGTNLLSMGKPLNGVKLKLLDKALHVTDFEGQLAIAGKTLSLGYFRNALASKERFIEFEGERYYLTGDIVSVDENGYYYFKGRIDNQVKVRGYRVDLEIVQHAISQHPLVNQVYVGITQNDVHGQNELVAFYSGSASQNQLIDALVQDFPQSHVPSMFIACDTFPLTENGKVDTKALLSSLSSRSSVGKEVASSTYQFVELVWCTVLQQMHIRPDDKFKDLGGDSFKALIVFSKLKKRFPTLTIAKLFVYPTISSLSAYLDSLSDDSSKTSSEQVLSL